MVLNLQKIHILENAQVKIICIRDIYHGQEINVNYADEYADERKEVGYTTERNETIALKTEFFQDFSPDPLFRNLLQKVFHDYGAKIH